MHLTEATTARLLTGWLRVKTDKWLQLVVLPPRAKLQPRRRQPRAARSLSPRLFAKARAEPILQLCHAYCPSLNTRSHLKLVLAESPIGIPCGPAANGASELPRIFWAQVFNSKIKRTLASVTLEIHVWMGRFAHCTCTEHNFEF